MSDENVPFIVFRTAGASMMPPANVTGHKRRSCLIPGHARGIGAAKNSSVSMGCSGKAQANSLDMIIALTIFAVIFISVSSLWDTVRGDFSSIDMRNDLEALSRYAAESLLATPGSPQDWHMFPSLNSSVAGSLGLVSSHYGIISEEKVSAMAGMNSTSYESYKEILGIRGAGYEFFLNVSFYNASDYIYMRSEIIGYREECENTVRINRAALSDKGNVALFSFYGCRT